MKQSQTFQWAVNRLKKVAGSKEKKKKAESLIDTPSTAFKKSNFQVATMRNGKVGFFSGFKYDRSLFSGKGWEHREDKRASALTKLKKT